jgi:hypothetical protein
VPCTYGASICEAPLDAPAGVAPDGARLAAALHPLLAGRSCGAPLRCAGEPEPAWEALGTRPAGLQVEELALAPVHGLWLVVWNPDCDDRDGAALLLTALAAGPDGDLQVVDTVELMPLAAARLVGLVERLEAGDPDGDGRGEAVLVYGSEQFDGEQCEFSPSARFDTAQVVNVLPRLEVVWEAQLSASYYESGRPVHGLLDVTDLDGDGRMDLAVEQQLGQPWECLAGYFASEEDREARCGDQHEQILRAAWLYRPDSDRWEDGGLDWANRLATAASSCPAWNETPLPDRAFVRDVWGAGPAAVFAVGVGGTIARWDGTGWRGESASTTASLFAVWGSAADRVFAVGEAGTIVRRDGSGWSAQTTGTVNHLYDVWGGGPDDVFAAGAAGTILHSDGGPWQPLATGTDVLLQAGCSVGPGTSFAVGEAGTIVRCGTDGCTTVPSGTTQPLLDVWCGGPDAVIAVGAGGAIVAWDGDAFQPAPSPTQETLEAVWGSGPHDVFAVGNQDVLLFDGTAWTRADVEPGQPLHDVAGAGPADVVAVGYGGAILSWNGAAWCRDSSGTAGELTAVWVDAAGQAFAAGSWGTGAHRAPAATDGP